MVCSDTAALLPAVQKLAEDVRGAKGLDLDAQGGRVATAAQSLLQAARVRYLVIFKLFLYSEI